jgi:hypothetical protein
MNNNECYKTCLTLAISTAMMTLASCGSISLHGGSDIISEVTPALSIVAASGTPQSQVIEGVFDTPLVAMVTTTSGPVAGMTVTFTAPISGASGNFADTHSNVTTAMTNSNGLATTAVFAANGTAGIYDVAASVPGAPLSADFSLTNTSLSNAYVFYLSGQEATFINFYALAGTVEIDSSGNVLGGEQDYNDAEGFTSPQPAGDSITGGSLKVDPTTGQGILTIDTNNPKLGAGGVEILAVQFVNSKHALIMQFDGVATSSGSMDLQTLPSSMDGGFAFTMAGVDPLYLPVAWGGILTISGATLQKGLADANDDGLVTKGIAFSGTLSAPDALGRGAIASTLNYNGASIALNYYVVGPEAIRIIDVDAFDAAIGSAYGQGVNATTTTNASLGNSVFGIAGIPFLINYAAAGMFFPGNTSFPIADFSGIADANELSYAQLSPASSITGTYFMASDGYGTLTIAPGNLGHVSLLGLYMTDPKLNLGDPNNITNGLGGALLADMDTFLPGGTGILVPQSDNLKASFAGKYAFAGWDIENFCCEFDFAGQGFVTDGMLIGTGVLSDPLLTLGSKKLNSGVTFSGTPLPDPNNAGRYTMLTANPGSNPLSITIDGTTTDFATVIYQANGGQLFWLGEDAFDVFLGTLQQQGSLADLPTAGKKSKR